MSAIAPLFHPLIGQPQAVELLSQAIERHRIAPAYLFSGTPGIGKRLAANCFLQALLHPSTGSLQNHPDRLWVEPTYLHQGKRLSSAEAEAAGVKRKTPPMVRLEQIREISQFLSRPALQADRAVVVIEAAETLPEPAANALLKTLEEPGKATIILCATSGEALLPTIVSRCQRIPFYRLDLAAITQVLQTTAFAEILNQPQILALAQGSPGAAIGHWQKLQSIPPDLLATVIERPKGLQSALSLARTIAKTLDGETQLWLVDYLQQHYWQSASVPKTWGAQALSCLEATKTHLLAYVQPQLVWEVTLMALAQDGHW